MVQASDQELFTVNIGSSVFELHPFFESLTEIFESPEEEVDFYCVHLSLNKRTLTVDLKAVKKESGLLLIIYDLTQHYNSYQSVTQVRNESVIKTELTIIKNQELEERERFKNRFIQNFSHELRNPLTSIMAITNILEDTGLNTEQSKMLQFLKASNTNLKLLLEDVLSISMIDTGRLAIVPKMFDLKHFFDLLEFTYKAKAKEKGLNLIASWDNKLPNLVEGDRLRLFQVATNLLDNAIKYTETGSVSLSIKLNQKRANRVSLRFQVEDTGMGIPNEKRGVIFESFKQLHAKGNAGGNGLGLAIASGLLHLMESDIKVKSVVGQGSEFYFDIALKFELLIAQETKGADSKNHTQLTIEKTNQPKLKLLLVEDDLHVQTTLFKILLSTGRFHIDVVYDGALVLQEVVSANYDIIVMDVNLPNLSGDQITKLIREFPFKNIKTIPIIGLTADGYQENIDNCRKAGMNKVLIKPFDKEDFLKSIFKTLGSSNRD
jgi:signal transduction histidine kinase/ActR/RegA family two-component response regulator